jgi:DNA-binding MurR/RpiR family transcriptional regulator
MTNIEIRTRSIYNSLNKREQKVAAYFLEHVDCVFTLPIAQLAEESGASQVAWVRFCKSIGFDGLKDMKKTLFSELHEVSSSSGENDGSLYTDIRDYSTVAQMTEAVKTSSIRALEDTMKLLDHASVEQAAKLIVQADTMKLFGVGASSLVAEDLFYKMIRIGKSTCFTQDLHVQLTYAATMSRRDVGFFVSNSGTTLETLETLRLAKEKGAKTIALTRFDRSPLAQEADVCLFTSSPEISHRSGAMSSRIAQLAVIDVLFTAVASQNYPHIEQELENSYKSCSRHKLGADSGNG